MKRSDLFREWARVLDICADTELHPLNCVKHEGSLLDVRALDYTPNIARLPPNFLPFSTDYEFALAIVEGKPVFKGDTLYGMTGNHYVITDCYGDPRYAMTKIGELQCTVLWSNLSWLQTRTF